VLTVMQEKAYVLMKHTDIDTEPSKIELFNSMVDAVFKAIDYAEDLKTEQCELKTTNHDNGEYEVYPHAGYGFVLIIEREIN